MKFLFFMVGWLTITAFNLSAAGPQSATAGATNLVIPAPASGDSATNTNDVAKPPGDLFTNSVDMELVKVGSFWAGKYEVTQKEYTKITGSNPSAFRGD